VALTGWAETAGGKRDDPRIVLDEVVGMWVALYALPRTLPYLLLAFLFFRVFDIWKPFGEPGRRGLGIMVDDLMAGVCANILVRAVTWLGGALF
jgi:phosphatidylglycerophosphatase A